MQPDMNQVIRFPDMPSDFNGGKIEGLIGDKRVTLALTPSDVHDAAELPQYLFGYSPYKYRGLEMCPVVLVDKDSDKYRTFDTNNAFKPVEVKASLQSAPPEIDATSSTSTYTVVDRFIGGFIPTVTELNADFNLRQRTAKRCADAILLDLELDINTLLGTNTNWAAGVRTAATDVWTDVTNGKPITDIMNALEKSYQEVREIWINDKAAHAFIRHPQVQDHMRQFYGDERPAINVTGDFAIPGIEAPFKVIKSRYLDTSDAMQRMLGTVAVLISGPPTPPSDGNEIMSAATFRRRGSNGTGWGTREYFVDGRGPEGRQDRRTDSPAAVKSLAHNNGPKTHERSNR